MHSTFDIDGSTSLLDWEYLPDVVQKRMQELFGLPDSCLTYDFQVVVSTAKQRVVSMGALAALKVGRAEVTLRQRGQTGGQSMRFVGMQWRPPAREKLHLPRGDQNIELGSYPVWSMAV